MHPEDRLDALLASPAAQRAASPLAADDELAPLMRAAGRLDALREATPSAQFTARLEQQFLARAEERAAARPALMRQSRWGGVQRGLYVRRGALWPAAAAALIVAIGAGTLTAAASAGPGSALFAIHRWEEGVRVQLASSATDRANLHLGYAHDALTALDAAVRRHDLPAYREALASLRAEDAAAQADLPAGAAGDAMRGQLAALHTQEASDLRAALPLVGWPERVATTDALADLGGLGGALPHITGVTLTPTDSGHRAKVLVTGTNFQPGAVLLVDGAPAGSVTKVSATQLTAEVDSEDALTAHSTIGVGNPDGTATLSARSLVHGLPSTEAGDEGTPASTTNPDKGGHTTGTPTPGSDNGNGKGRPTPTPSPTHTTGDTNTPGN